MKSFSLSAAWLETLAFIKREGGLLIPVTLLFVALPLALVMIVMPIELRQITPGVSPTTITVTPAFLPVFLGASVAITIGSLTCYALTLKPAISMREALALGFRRASGGYIGMLIAYGVCPLLGVFLLSLVIAATQSTRALMMGAGLTVFASLYMLLLIVFLAARFRFLSVLLIDQAIGPIEAIKRSWAMTRGQMWRLAAFVVALLITVMLGQAVVGILLALIGFAIGGLDIARQASDFGGAVVLAIGQMVMIVMTSRLYRHINPA